MDTEKLFQVLSSMYPLSEDFKSAILSDLISLSLPKGYHLLEAPRVSDQAYFLERGFAVTYIFHEGQKQIECLWGAGQVILSARSFFEQVPSREFIQLMVPSEVLFFSHANLMQLFARFPEANTISRAILSRYFEHCRERRRDLQHFTTSERFDKLIMNHPDIEQLLSQDQIASYLGIAPQSLSRLKRRKRSE